MSDGTEPKRYLITIGAPSCKALELPHLGRVESDVQEITHFFEGQGYDRALANEINANSTPSQIKNSMARWFSHPDRESSDCVVIYYAGHAETYGNRKKYHLCITNSDNNLGNKYDSLLEIESFVGNFYLHEDQKYPGSILLILDACYAGSSGEAIAQVRTSLKSSAPEGAGLWLLYASGYDDKAIDGSFVAAFKSVLCPKSRRFSEDEFIALDKLVSAINQYFVEQYQKATPPEEGNRWGQTSEYYAIAGVDAAQFIRNPHFRKENLNKEFSLELQGLDFKKQKDTFDDFLESDRTTGVFFIEVSDDGIDELQKCLVNRLGRSFATWVNQKPKFEQNSQFKETRIKRDWRGRSLEKFCEWIAPELGLPSSTSLDEIHESITQVCQTQSMLIALYRSPEMGDAGIALIFEEFWRPLEEKFLENQASGSQGRLVFLLTGAKPMAMPTGLQPDDYLKLDQISTTDVKDWFRQKTVQTLINRLSDPKIRNNLPQIYQQRPEHTLGDNAYDAMQIVCQVLGFPGGLVEFEEHWTLSGDLVG
jgi:hypothetical protein